jgi:hypothetical protein
MEQEDQLGIMDDGNGMILHGEIKQQHLAVNVHIHLLLQLLQEDSFLLHLLNHGCHHHGRVVTLLTSQVLLQALYFTTSSSIIKDCCTVVFPLDDDWLSCAAFFCGVGSCRIISFSMGYGVSVTCSHSS